MIYSGKKSRVLWTSLAALAVIAVLALMAGCLQSQSPMAPADANSDRPDLAIGLATVPSQFAEATVASGLAAPTAMEIAPDGRVFVCEQTGKVRVIRAGVLQPTPFVSLSVNHDGERGVLGIAFDPAFTTNNFVYIYYTTPSGPHNRVSRFTANGDVMQSGSEKVIFELPTLVAIYHNGGAIHFGQDGKLYIAVGDNKTSVLTPPGSQNKSSLLGKILRINSDGSIPSDNPFYTSASGNNRAIWVLGLRNPFTFAFQPGTTRMFINDVGEATWEEIDDGVKGANYGWPASEGPDNTSGFKGPFSYYSSTSSSPCAIIGAAFYNPSSSQFPSDYTGDYFYCDYCAGWIKRIDVSTKAVTTFATGLSNPVDLKVSKDGALYYLEHGGVVKKVTYTGSLKPSISSNPASVTVSVGGSATFKVGANGTSLTYQWQRNKANISGATSTSYTKSSIAATESGTKYRCVVKNSAGADTSSEATLTVTSNKPPVPTISTPALGATYKAGQTISYSGSATDPEDGTLPASAYSWEIRFQHETHYHPFAGPITGVKSGSFVVPTTNEVSPNVWYRIMLTVTDSKGMQTMVQRDVMPITQNLTLASNPTGLQLLLDGQPVTASKTITGVVGITRSLSAASVQFLSGKYYTFGSWSDGGARSHDISTPATATTYTATCKQSGTLYEAENATKSGVAVASSSAGFTGTGFGDYQNASGDFIEWTVNASAAGSHPVDFRFANASTASRPLAIKVNGTTVSSSMAFPPTGSWTTWKFVTMNLTLNAGSNKIRATDIGSSGPNMDHINVR